MISTGITRSNRDTSFAFVEIVYTKHGRYDTFVVSSNRPNLQKEDTL